MRRIFQHSLHLSLCACAFHGAIAADPSRGLWVGEVALNAVNEATGAVGDSNTYEFSDPELTTPTSDTAYLRLILHVNGAGQVQLLKSVAVVPGEADAEGNTNPLLLTDPELYAEHSGIATRVASAFYDFGDSHAVAAVQTIIDTATDTATTRALAGDDESTILSLLQTEMSDLLEEANVSTAYLDTSSTPDSFLTDDFFDLAQVQTLADEIAALIDAGSKTAADYALDAGASDYAPFLPDPLGGDFGIVVDAAFDLRDSTFYRDTRGIDAIVDIVEGTARGVESLDGGLSLVEKQAYARVFAEAAWHNAADVEQSYNRFLASQAFEGLPEAILPIAVQAALNGQASGETEPELVTSIRATLGSVTEVQAAYAGAEVVFSASLWGDRRGTWAVDAVIDAAVAAAAAQVLADQDSALLAQAIELAVATTLEGIAPGRIFASAPSEAYNDFVASSDYVGATDTAADTAASEAAFQYAEGVSDSATLRTLVERAVSKALVAIRNDAAAISKFGVPLNGTLAAGETVTGEFYLPALAPTNPFMHRLHPDHSEGFAITRRIALSVDDAENTAQTLAGYGVSRLTGTYEEEIFGLHKPLGPNQDIGLKTQGSFNLNRLTLVDSLNF